MITEAVGVSMRKARIPRVSKFSSFVFFYIVIHESLSFDSYALGIRVKFVLLQK
jgi:hypothetical protein